MSARGRKFRSQLLLLLLCAQAGASQGLFDDRAPLDVELRGPLAATMADTRDRKERTFLLSVGDVQLEVDVRVRGKSRVEACSFRPLRLAFPADNTAGTVFEGLRSLKLVTHCRATEQYEQNVLDEYAAYRIFGLFSDVAYRSRLLHVRYVDTDRPDAAPLIRYGLAIESTLDLAFRVNGQVPRLSSLRKSLLDKDHASLMFTFQYMIGNTDWSLGPALGETYCCHNADVLSINGSHYAVPYDFDQAGLVNAGYASPHPSLGLRSVRTRHYLGYCIDSLPLENAIRATGERQAAIMDIVNGLPQGAPGASEYRRRYLQQYFDAARDAGMLADRFRRQCKK